MAYNGFTLSGQAHASLDQTGSMISAESANSENDSSQFHLECSSGKKSSAVSNHVPVPGQHKDHAAQDESTGHNAYVTLSLTGPANGHAAKGAGQAYIDDEGDVESRDSSQDDEALPLISGKSPRSRMCERTNFYIYLSHFLSAWGDNMWTFAVGVFLVEIDGDSLQLTATFGLTMGVSTLLLGPIIGDWVDTMPRLRVAQEALVLQNVMIALCAGFVYNLLEFEPEIEGWGEWAPIAHYVLIIALGSGAFLAHIANTIAIERDWVVEICAQDEDRLASMTATMRAIDLTAMIVAPIATGQIMTLSSSKIGALFIAGWNVVSFFVEYFLLWMVYTSVPALQKDKSLLGGSSEENKDLLSSQRRGLVESMGQSHTIMTLPGGPKKSQNEAETNVDVKPEYRKGSDPTKVTPSKERQTCLKRLHRLFSGVIIIAQGWKTYAKYKVMLSGISLALLYMTVLGFDNVTIGYAKMQCLSEFEVGLMMGAAGLIGTLGTFAYPIMRRCLGLPWTGMVALTLQSTTLAMCVVSVWLPGSPFDLDNPDYTGMVCEANSTTSNGNWTDASFLLASTSNNAVTDLNLTSVAVLMAGIIAARFGLWIADLAITQMFLETVVENERGIVNGVQQSLNQFLDLIKFLLVIILPKTTQFGLLVILSFSFVLSGWLLYLVFLIRVPKQLFAKKVAIAG